MNQGPRYVSRYVCVFVRTQTDMFHDTVSVDENETSQGVQLRDSEGGCAVYDKFVN